MTEKNKKRALAIGALILAFIVLWILLRKTASAVPTSTAAPLQIGGSNYGAPGGLSFGGPGSYNITTSPFPNISLGGTSLPSVTIAQPASPEPCECNSCGCDPNSDVNQFSTSITATLNAYSQSLAQIGANYAGAIVSNIPDVMAQYIATADPTAPSGLNG